MSPTLPAALRSHWPEYLMEAALLGAFMVSALGFTVLLEHPASPVRAAVSEPLVRRACMGLAMGCTAVALVHSRFGKRSGAHFNPALTLTYLRLGKIARADALFYVIAQVVGAVLGVLAVRTLAGGWVADSHVRFAVTLPGPLGELPAFLAEVAISFGLMATVLTVSNTPHIARFTGWCAGALVALYITFEAPLSGMSMNPARTLGSAAGAGIFTSLWIYFTAPLFGMLLAAELYVRRLGARRVLCAKLHHDNRERCIFRCGFRAAA
jgi:aquaporin Z